MTTALNTPRLPPKTPAHETAFEDRGSSAAAGNFARLMEQVVGAPGAKARKTAGRSQADATLPDVEEDSETDEIPQRPASPGDQDVSTAPQPPWLAGMPATVFNRPLPSFGQLAPAEAQDLSALPEFLELANSAPVAGLTEAELCSASVDTTKALLQPNLAQSQPSGSPSAEKGGLAEDAKNMPMAGRLDGNALPVGQPGDSAEEAMAVGAGTGPAAIPSNSRPAVAGACPASAVVEFTVREQALMTAVSDSGTSAASHTGMMQATREMTETACPAEQDLPCGLPVIGAATFVGSDRKTRFNEGDRLADLPAGAAEMALALADQPTRHELSVYAEAVASPTVPAEGIRRAIENAAAALRRTDASSLSLVLTPDSNTQLALHVELQQGRLDVRVVLERGDFAALGTEWSQLQSRFAEQGVRLAPLVSGAGTGDGLAGEPSFSQGRSRQESSLEDWPIPGLGKSEAPTSGVRTAAATNGRAWWA